MRLGALCGRLRRQRCLHKRSCTSKREGRNKPEWQVSARTLRSILCSGTLSLCLRQRCQEGPSSAPSLRTLLWRRNDCRHHETTKLRRRLQDESACALAAHTGSFVSRGGGGMSSWKRKGGGEVTFSNSTCISTLSFQWKSQNLRLFCFCLQASLVPVNADSTAHETGYRTKWHVQLTESRGDRVYIKWRSCIDNVRN